MAFDPKSKRLFLSAAGQRARPRPKPGSFVVLVVGRE